MGNSRKIYNSLINNSNNDAVSNFLQEIFKAESNGLHQWRIKYNELIDEYYKEYLK